LAPVVGAGAALAVGLVLVAEAWKAEGAERYRLAAVRCKGATDPAARDRQRAYLRAATALEPGDSALQIELARAYHDEFERGGATAVTDYLRPSLRGYLRARALCPLGYEAHLRLAAHVRDLARSDGISSYLDRARVLRPYDARVWYLCGAREAAAGRPGPAWQCWRRSLECSDDFLPSILEESARALSGEEIADHVIPERSALLVQAAALLEARPDGAASARPLLGKALRLLESRAGPLSAEELHAKARAHRALGQAAEARQAYEALLAREPRWRYEFVQLLYEEGQLPEARRELVILLEQEPANAPARDLYRAVLRDLADSGRP
jgi:tetratricopeptide (TPR) repeat protein